VRRGWLQEIVRLFVEWRNLAHGFRSFGWALSQLSPVADASFRGLGISADSGCPGCSLPERVATLAAFKPPVVLPTYEAGQYDDALKANV
jgi:hypothetical protein